MRSSLVGVLITKRARRLEVRKHRSAANDARQAERSRRGIPRCGSLRVGGAQHELWGPASPGRSKPQACACPTGSSTACASRCGPRLRRRCIAELRVRGSVRGSDRRQNGATNRRHYSLEFGLSTAVGGTAQQAAAHATGLRSERSRVRITPGALSFLGSTKPVPATGRSSGAAGAEAPSLLARAVGQQSSASGPSSHRHGLCAPPATRQEERAGDYAQCPATERRHWRAPYMRPRADSYSTRSASASAVFSASSMP